MAMNRQQASLLGSAGLGAGLGAGLMYLLDPQGGRRRRAVAKDKTVHALKQGGSALGKASRDLGNRGKGLVAGSVSKLRKADADDQVLRDRVRSKLGRLVSHPSSIEVTAEEGQVVLSGPVLASETDRLVKGVRKVKGVRDVEDRLEVHEQAGDEPGLQGNGRTGQRSLPPALRLCAGTAGAGLALLGLKRRDKVGAALGVAGLGLLAGTSLNPRRRAGTGTEIGPGEIVVEKTIHVNAPVDEVFGLWSNFESFPRFMDNVMEVTDLGQGRSRWVVKGPAGSRVQWNAEVTRLEPGKVLAWQSEPGSVIESSGLVRFERDGEGTRVDVHLAYTPPGGTVGHGVAFFLGEDPKTQMDEDLLRMKSLLEEGKTTAKGRTARLEEVEQSDYVPVHS